MHALWWFLASSCIFGQSSALQHSLNDEAPAPESATSSDIPEAQIDPRVTTQSLRGAMAEVSNATIETISLCVATMHKGLAQVQSRAYKLGNRTKRDVDLLLAEVDRGTGVRPFLARANSTLGAFLTLFIPTVVASNMSSDAVARVLQASGFLHASDELGNYTRPADAALNATLYQVIGLQRSVQDLLGALRKTGGGSVTRRKLERDLHTIQTRLSGVVARVSIRCNQNIKQGYELVAEHLRSTADRVPSPRRFGQLNRSLATLQAHVSASAQALLEPLGMLSVGFTEAIGKMRAGRQHKL